MKKLIFILLCLSSTMSLQAQRPFRSAPVLGQDDVVEIIGDSLLQNLAQELAQEAVNHNEDWSEVFPTLSHITFGLKPNGKMGFRGEMCFSDGCREYPPQIFMTRKLLVAIATMPQDFPQFSYLNVTMQTQFSELNLDGFSPNEVQQSNVALCLGEVVVGLGTMATATWMLLSHPYVQETARKANEELARNCEIIMADMVAGYGSWLAMEAYKDMSRKELFRETSDQGIGDLNGLFDVFRYHQRPPGGGPEYKDKSILALTVVMASWLYREDALSEAMNFFRELMFDPEVAEPEALLELIDRAESGSHTTPFYTLGVAVQDMAARMSVMSPETFEDWDDDWPAGMAGYRALVIHRLIEHLSSMEEEDQEGEIDFLSDTDAQTAELAVYIAMLGGRSVTSPDFVSACRGRLMLPDLQRLVLIGQADISSLTSRLVSGFLETWNYPEASGELISGLVQQAGLEELMSRDRAALVSSLLADVREHLNYLLDNRQEGVARSVYVEKISNILLVIVNMSSQPDDCLEPEQYSREAIAEFAMRRAFMLWLEAHYGGELSELPVDETIRGLRRHLPLSLTDADMQEQWNTIMDMVSPQQLAIISDVPISSWSDDVVYATPEAIGQSFSTSAEQARLLQEVDMALVAAGNEYQPDAYMAQFLNQIASGQNPSLATALGAAARWFVENHGVNIMVYRWIEVRSGIIASDQTRPQDIEGDDLEIQADVDMNDSLDMENPSDLLPFFNVRPEPLCRMQLYLSQVQYFWGTMVAAAEEGVIPEEDMATFLGYKAEINAWRAAGMFPEEFPQYEDFFWAYARAWEEIIVIADAYLWDPQSIDMIDEMIPWMNVIASVAGNNDRQYRNHLRD